MSKEREFLDYLCDILDASKNIQIFIQNYNFNQFENDTKTVYAVIRAFEIIGEATKYIPKNIREKFPEISWNSMAGFRNILIHNYISVDLNVVYKTCVNDIPNLILQLENALMKLQQS